MAIEPIPMRYATDDGQQFATKEEALRHEALVEAEGQCQEAQWRLGRLLAETQRTADGRLFEFTTLRDYWYVSAWWGGLPVLRRVSFYIWNCRVDRDRDQDEVVIWQEESEGKDRRTQEYRIGELYVSERAAEKDLLAAQETWLAERAAEIAKLRERLAS